jgi:hypothetical protein
MTRIVPTSYKMTDHDKACIALLARHLGVSNSDVLRLGYRALAKKEGVKLPLPPR